MDEMYEYLKKKIEEMHKNAETTTTVDYAEIAKLYQLVCFMMQIQKIANGWD